MRTVFAVSAAICMSTFVAAQDSAVTISSPVVRVGNPATVNVTLDVTLTNVKGWSYGVCHDPTLTLNSASGIASGTVVADYESLDIFTNGFTHAVVIDTTAGVTTLPVGSYNVVTATYIGSGNITFCDQALGVPVVANMVVGGLPATSLATTWTDGFVTETDHPVNRGDCNQDGGFINLIDVIFSLESLFAIGPAAQCDDACDTNDDGFFDISDPLYSLLYLFDGGTAPPGVGICGADATPDGIGCNFSVCP